MLARPDQRYRDQPTFFGGNSPSPDAFLVDHGKRSRDEQYQWIVDELTEREKLWYSRIVIAGVRGITRDELAVKYSCPQNAFSGRITALKQAGLVRDTKERRETSMGGMAAVIVATSLLETDQTSIPFSEQEQTTVSNQVDSNDDDDEGSFIPDEPPMPGQLTRETAPLDQHGEPMKAGNHYRFDRGLYFCFEGDDGELMVQRCTSLGCSSTSESAGRVLAMLPGNYTVERVDQ